MADAPNTEPNEVQKPDLTPDKKPKKPGLFKRAGTGVKSWFSWDAIKSNTAYVGDNARSLLDVQKPEHTESFEEAMVRLNLTEADIANQKAAFLRLALIIGSFAIVTLAYTLYLLFQFSLGSAALAFVVTLLCIATACRYHFWYFQVKNRKLGCTINEWLNAKVSGGK